MSVKILVVDDEVEILRLLIDSVEGFGYDVDSAIDYNSAKELLNNNSYNIVITDKNMPGENPGDVEGGLELIITVKEECPETEVIMITGFATLDTAIYAMKLGAFDYVVKPFNLKDLKNKIEKILNFQSFLSSGSTIRFYKSLKTDFMEFLDENDNIKESLRKELIDKFTEVSDSFFQTLNSREKVLIEQREALANITYFVGKLKESTEKEAEMDELLNNIYDESTRRI